MKDRLDHVDFRILTILTEDAQTPYTEVAKKLIISPGTVHLRMRKMKDLGLIVGATLNLDYSKIDWKLTVFLGIYLTESTLYKEVITKLMEVKEVVQVHHVTGKYDIFMKMHAKDSIHYREVYQDYILTIDGIKAVESFISVQENLTRHIEFKE